MLIHSDCLEALRNLPDNSVDSVVTDPPYGLSFMGKKWDYDVPSVDIWLECLRVLKPGGHLLSFAGSRTYHRITCAIEDAGFEIRDQIMWVYGSGFPKSLNIGKAIDKMQGNERTDLGINKNCGTDASSGDSIFGIGKTGKQVSITKGSGPYEGYGTALKPAHEPICVARKPISEPSIAANVLKWGTGAINIDGCRVKTNDIPNYGKGKKSNVGFKTSPQNNDRPVYDGLGRFPANFIHDGSDEVLELFPETKSSALNQGHKRGNGTGNSLTGGGGIIERNYGNDSGSAARFFYCAKASKAERGDSNNHPTVKPLALMRYLIKLVTPPDGVVLDPFLGSGTTAIAAVLEGFDWIGIEREAEYCDIARARIAAAEPQQIEVAL
jgi:site-specific DNA-methyltransferase (adenine-specific)